MENTPYYTCVIGLACMSLLTLGVLIYENGRMNMKDKKYFIYAIIGIGLACLSEWGAIMLNGADESTMLSHNILKGLDYITTPAAGALFTLPVTKGQSKLKTAISAVLGVNTILQIVSMFNGCMYYIDADNYYQHGPLYTIYYVISGLVALLVTIEFISYGKRFKKRNILSIVLIGLIIIGGVALQEFVDHNLRVTCLSLALASIFLFIHYSEFNQMEFDANLEEKERLLSTDPLTGLYSRFAYNRFLMDFEGTIKRDVLGGVKFAICECDLNGLKTVNDVYGHEAGDRYILNCSKTIKDFFKHGTIYRTGGDEFVIVFENANYEKIEKLENKIKNFMDAEMASDKNAADRVLFAAGFAMFDPTIDSNYDDVFKRADKAMYEAKGEYYTKSGVERRKI